MSEIKFACPHCNQHIACDGDYASLAIDCPACGGSMAVPGLMGVTSQLPESLIVASTPSPKRSPATEAPTFGAWTREQWQHHYDEVTGADSRPSPFWLVAAIGTIIFAVVLRANNAGLWPILSCLLVGGIISGLLASKSRSEGSSESGAAQILKVLGYICAGIIILPCIALGILFVGCGGCR